MPAGLQVWNAAGVPLLDTNSAPGLWVGYQDVGAPYDGTERSGTIYVPGWTGVERVWFSVLCATAAGKPPGQLLTFGRVWSGGGNAINWSAYATLRIFYGFY